MSLPPSYNLLAQYPNKYFIETGTYRSDAVAAAIDAGFAHIRTIDIDPAAAEFCANRFWLSKNTHLGVKCYTGDSAMALWSMIADIDEPMTILLDAHWQFFHDEEPGNNPFPLLQELSQIAKHPIKSNVIIVDDWHIFYPDRVGYSKQDVINALLRINPAYELTMYPNPVIDGLLVAHT
jgi:hypothetical protein